MDEINIFLIFHWKIESKTKESTLGGYNNNRIKEAIFIKEKT